MEGLYPLITTTHFTMAGMYFKATIAILMLAVVWGSDIIGPMIERMDSLEEELVNVENRVTNRIKSVRSELKRQMKRHVRKTITKLLEGEFIEEMVRNQIVSEVRQLRQGNHQMKRQLQQLLKSLNDVQVDMKTCKVALQKAERDTNDLKMCFNNFVESKMLKWDLERCENNIVVRDGKVSVNDGELKKVKQDLKMSNETSQQNLTEVTTPSAETSTSTAVVTTRRPIEDRSRLLVAPYRSSRLQKFRQLNIHSNSISNYALQSLKNVLSIAYISKLKKLLIGVHSPNKVLSSQLDSYGVTSVRENVEIYGMAVDEEREFVFLATHSPRKSISRMTTHGKHFTVMTDLKNFTYPPFSVAVNNKKRAIYACIYDKVIVVSYEGRVLQTLATGKYMFAVTLDTTGGNLYYNDGKKVMKLSLSKNITTELLALSVKPFNLVYDRNIIYFSSISHSTGTIGAVDVGENVTEYTLQNINMKTVYYMICLVP